MLKVYIASPYNIGDKEKNVHRAIEAANTLWKLGLCPYVALLNHYWNKLTPKSEEEWLKMDFQWLDSCSILWRLPGKSVGAEKEIRYAKMMKIPVAYSLKEVLDFAGKLNRLIWGCR